MDESVTRRDPRVEARVASSAYAQARAILDAEPEITAAALVEQLRAHAAELAAEVAAELGDPVAEAAVVTPREPAGQSGPAGAPSAAGGLGAAAAEARARAPGEEA